MRAGRIHEAESIIVRMRSMSDSESNLCFAATKGLFEFKKNHVATGRKAYLDVMAECQKQGNLLLYMKAHLNLALAEVEASTPEAENTVHAALAVSEGSTYPDITLLRQQILKRVKQGARRG